MTFFDIKTGETILLWITAAFAILLAVYTAFLFAQAKGRDFWQSPTLPLHMLVHSIMAGVSIFVLAGLIFGSEDWMTMLTNTLIIALLVNVFTLVTELTITHPTTSAKKVVTMITKGRYKNLFWIVSVIIGNIIPLVFLIVGNTEPLLIGSAVLVLIGIIATEKIWVEAPQRVPLA